MINSDDILNDMKAKMDEYKNQYEEINKEIERVGTEYQGKIDALQQERVKLLDEGNALLDKLKMQREQVRGMHASLYNQYNKYVKPEEGVKEEAKPAGVVAEEKPVTEKVKAQPKKKAEKQVEKPEQGSSELSEAEKEALAKIATSEASAKKAETKPAVDDKNNEIPEYLKDEYKK